MTTTWADLSASIRSTLRIDPRLILSIASRRAHKERRECRAIGWERKWRDVFAYALTLTWTEARSHLDTEIALRERAKLPAAEQWARTAELQAEIYETAIPPRPEAAAWLRRKAAALRGLAEREAA